MALRNHKLYMAIISCIATRAMTVASICKKTGAGEFSVREALFQMRACGVTYISGHRRNRTGKGDPASLWRAGMEQGMEPARPIGKVYTPGVEVVAFSGLLRCLMTEPTSVGALQSETGLNRQTVYKMLRLGKALGVLHIAAYERDARAGDFAPCWKFSPGAADVDRPPKRDPREVWREYEQRRRILRRQQRIVHALAANTTHFTEAA